MISKPMVEMNYEVVSGSGAKRQFPHLVNKCSAAEIQPRFRRFLPHGYANEVDFRPHSRHLEPRYTMVGPDARSSLLHMHTCSSQTHLDPHSKLLCQKSLSSFDDSSIRDNKSSRSRDFYCNSTRDCAHSGRYTAFYSWTPRELQEQVTGDIIDEDNKFLNQRRNDITCKSPGDKLYRNVESSTDFYKLGSTYSAVNFGSVKPSEQQIIVYLRKAKTLSTARRTYAEIRREEDHKNDVEDVKSLDTWSPAPPLVCPVIPSRKSTSRSRPRPAAVSRARYSYRKPK